MERHRTLDSSMSSLYSGSNISQTPSRQLEPSAYNYPTSSAAPSPTPSGAGAGHLMPNNGHNDTLGSGGSNASHSGLRATTIGTVVVRCGPIQLVIALLQVSFVLFFYFLDIFSSCFCPLYDDLINEWLLQFCGFHSFLIVKLNRNFSKVLISRRLIYILFCIVLYDDFLYFFFCFTVLCKRNLFLYFLVEFSLVWCYVW